MIKITHALSTKDPVKFMSDIVEGHWSSLNILRRPNGKQPAEYNNNSLIYKVNGLLEEYKKDIYLTDIANDDTKLNGLHIDFLKYLTDKNYSKLKTCITGTPKELEQIVDDVFSQFGSDIFEEKNESGTLGASKFSQLLISRIFNYKTFRSSDKCIVLYNKLELEGKYCPYCNSNQFEIISKEEPTEKNHKSSNGLLLFDLDHFFLKYKHPFLALAFYNLIPCCPTCNSRVRGDVDFSLKTHINPYHESFHEHFEFTLDSMSILRSTMAKKLTTFELSIKQRSNSTRQGDMTCKDLKITNKLDSKVYTNDVIHVASTFLKYHNKNSLEFSDMLHGIHGQNVPFSSKFISDVQRGKLRLDIVNLYRKRINLPILT